MDLKCLTIFKFRFRFSEVNKKIVNVGLANRQKYTVFESASNENRKHSIPKQIIQNNSTTQLK